MVPLCELGQPRFTSFEVSLLGLFAINAADYLGLALGGLRPCEATMVLCLEAAVILSPA